MNRIFFFLALALSAVLSQNNCKAEIFIETENFQDKGGWVVDHQAFEKIRSSYLMAHGMGRPVKDAVTKIDVKDPGLYYVYVSTYNWTSPWYDGEGPGAFQVKIDGVTLENVLGTQGSKWGWQYAGKISIGKKTEISLHDLTGFNGRADAIYLTKKKKAPEADYMAFDKKRCVYNSNGEVTEVPSADLVVIGGGVAGCSVALTAARYGLDVVLVDNLPWLGGSNALGVKSCGLMYKNLYPALGNITCQVIGADISRKNDPDAYFERVNGTGYITAYTTPPAWGQIEDSVEESSLLKSLNNLNAAEYEGRTKAEVRQNLNEYNRKKRSFVREELLRTAGVDIYQNIHIFSVGSDGKHISSVRGKHLRTGKEYSFSGTMFVDCTGDGTVGYLAGAQYMIGREGKDFANEPSAPLEKDDKKMGMSMHWYAYPRGNSGSFPDVEEIPWAMQCSDEYYIDGASSNWQWETGLEYDNALEAELVRDNFLRAVFGNWAYLKNHVEKYRNYRLDYLQYIGMKRESRRIVGGLVLNENDIVNKTEYPDASFTTTWTMDLHYAQEKNARYFPGWEWMTWCTNDEDIWVDAYHVPYRCLYSKDIDNLFIGGRCMSVTHQALGTVRVQSTLGMAGEVIGMAAAICKEHEAMPKDVYEAYLEELKAMMKKGAPLR